MDLVGCGAVVCSGETGTDRVCAANPPRRAATTDAAGRQAPSGIPRPGWGPRNPHRRLSATVFRGFFLGSSALIKGTLHAIAVTQTPKGKDTRKRGQVCCAYWCSRRKGRNNGMAKVPMLFRGHASKSMACKGQAKQAPEISLSGRRGARRGRRELSSGGANQVRKGSHAARADHRYCKLHEGEDGTVLPLLRDPVMLGTTTGLNSVAVDGAAAHTAVGVARDKIAADRGSPASNRADRLAVRQTSINGTAPIGPW